MAVCMKIDQRRVQFGYWLTADGETPQADIILSTTDLRQTRRVFKRHRSLSDVYKLDQIVRCMYGALVEECT
jgi:hypothetical protein